MADNFFSQSSAEELPSRPAGSPGRLDSAPDDRGPVPWSSSFERLARKEFDKWDTNRDEGIGPDEWKRPRSDFSLADKNGDGRIDRQEFTEFTASRMNRPSQAAGERSRSSPSPAGTDSRSEQKPGSTASPNVDTAAQTLDARYAKYAELLIAKYDADGDGALNAEESSKLRIPVKDVDGDGRITAEEVAKSLMKR
jgi:Ca2+-binding EF-hand superfamily protein